MKTLLFATGNEHKVREIQAMLDGLYQLSGLADIGCTEDIPETSPSIAGNALQKARYIKEHYGLDCFAEDSGLEVDALNGEPGVLSARYAGPGRNSDDNMALLLQRLGDNPNRRARFRTVIALLLNGQERVFEGTVEGHITHQRQGNGGFGYDPVFIPDGFTTTFAEMSPEQKNAVSHRGKATRLLIGFLKTPS